MNQIRGLSIHPTFVRGEDFKVSLKIKNGEHTPRYSQRPSTLLGCLVFE